MKKQCLLIDDDLDDQEVFLMCLHKVCENIDCMTANDGAEAISLLESDTTYTPDYIFLDVNMPKMNGLECLKNIKVFDRLKHTKIFMYSTSSENAIVHQSKALGADDFIVKPSKTTELKEKLSQLLISQ